MKKHTLRLTLAAASALSVSIASQLQAAPYVSNGAGGGIWEDPATWLPGNPPPGYPDTFVGDSATITAGDFVAYDDNDLDGDGGVSTPATPFTTAMGVVAGGLSVANGNSITVDTGSILTQANLPHEIRIGEGAGGVSGVGTLTIDTGAIFASGSAVGVAVGSDLADLGRGVGTVNLKDGTFVMGFFGGAGVIPAGPASLGVGIEGSMGTFNVGDGIGAAGSAIVDLEFNGNNMGVGVTNQLGSTAGMGIVTVKADGNLGFSTGDLLFGEAGGSGTLQVNGGTVGNGAIATGDMIFGSNGGTGIFNVTAGTVNTAASLTGEPAPAPREPQASRAESSNLGTARLLVERELALTAGRVRSRSPAPRRLLRTVRTKEAILKGSLSERAPAVRSALWRSMGARLSSTAGRK